MKKYYRVTEILKATQSEEKRKALLKWQKTLQKKLGISEAQKETEKILKNGTYTHKLIEDYLQGKTATPAEKIIHLRPLLNLIKSYEPLTVEQRYWSEKWKLTGQIDLSYENEGLVLLDWTTSANFKKRAWIDEKFIQMGGYCHLLDKAVDLLTCVVIRPHTYQIFEETNTIKYQALFMDRWQKFMMSEKEREELASTTKLTGNETATSTTKFKS